MILPGSLLIRTGGGFVLGILLMALFVTSTDSPTGGTPVAGTSPGMAQPVRPVPTFDPSRSTTTQRTPVAGMSAIQQMEVAFIGTPRQSVIKARLDEAMRLYGTPITEENYSRAGSALVTLRQEFGPSEMDILDYMIRSYVAGVNIDFPGMAGLSAAALAAGDR